LGHLGNAMVPGFNHNIKHKGRVFHIQTEDSGVRNPHIITHLFVGGNILASKKTRYEDVIGQHEYEKTVRSMMEEQHKQMLRNLINGVYDTVDAAPAFYLDGPAPLNTEGDASYRAAASPSSTNQIPAPVPSLAMAPGDVGVSAAPAGLAPVPLPPEVLAARSPPPKEVPAERSQRAATVFGEDFTSEQSLDEVILSYLAEDLSELE
jgi:hypothetical protein